jgi:UDP-glucose 4-epimerase
VRVVVVGASGNVGTSLLAALADEAAVDSVLGVARRVPTIELPKMEWAEADVAEADLVPFFRGADAVVHLAWAIQPSRDLNALWRTNVKGSRRVFRAVAEAEVGTLVYGSSVGAYSPGPKDRFVDESWATNGIETSFYSRHKAEVERELDRFEREVPQTRVVRMRPGLIFKREAASGIRRVFAGPFFPSPLARRGAIPFLPNVPQLRFQAVHSLDVGDAYRRALVSDARGAFNLAADPVLDPPKLAELLGARLIPVSAHTLRSLAAGAWALRLQPSPPGWVDLGLNVPLLDASRAREELGWAPARGADEAFCELIDGLREGDGLDTPPLSPRTGGPLRIRELLTGVGERP